MASIVYDEKPLNISDRPFSEDSRYHRGSVPIDCSCRLPEAAAEVYHKSQLHIVTPNRRVKVFGKWTEEKLRAAVTDRLLQTATRPLPHSYKKIPQLSIESIATGVPYNPILHRGIYSESVLKRLHSSGVSESVVIRAMKFGLRHLDPEYLNYFRQFGVAIPALRSHKLWEESVDDSLVISLRAMGFDEKISRKITLNGLLVQSELCLMQLMLAGVDIPGILNWQGPLMEVGTRLTKFLRKLGISENMLQLVVQKGVDEESIEMLKDLGYTETEEEEHLGMHEVVICECDLTIFGSEISSPIPGTNSLNTVVSKIDQSKESVEEEKSCLCFCSGSTSTVSNSLSGSSQQSLVNCKAEQYAKRSSMTNSELLSDRSNYLRQTVMIPLTWAMGRALRYRPSDPKHYIACQLLRWRYGDVCKKEKKEAEQLAMTRTMEMDRKLMEQKRRDEEELVAKQEAETLQNIPCHRCHEHQQIHRVKERCRKCVRKWIPNYEPCELPKVCSSCEVDFSAILNTDSTTTTDESNSQKAENAVFRDAGCLMSHSQTCYTKCIESSRGDYACGESVDSAFRGEIV